MGDRDGGRGLFGEPSGRKKRQQSKNRSLPAGSGVNLRGIFGVSREEAPEEMIFLLRDAADSSFGAGKQSGTQKWSSQEGPWNIGVVSSSGEA